jgi:hypothetical protein
MHGMETEALIIRFDIDKNAILVSSNNSSLIGISTYFANNLPPKNPTLILQTKKNEILTECTNIPEFMLELSSGMKTNNIKKAQSNLGNTELGKALLEILSDYRNLAINGQKLAEYFAKNQSLEAFLAKKRLTLDQTLSLIEEKNIKIFDEQLQTQKQLLKQLESDNRNDTNALHTKNRLLLRISIFLGCIAVLQP